MNRELIKTGDNSYTFRVPELDEHYHSVHGARTESMHVFIQAGLRHYVEQHPGDLKLLEVGMGTGLNVLLTALEPTLHRITYIALEPFPLPADLFQQLELSDAEENRILQQIHTAAWHEQCPITNRLQLRKLPFLLENWEPEESFDLVYYDAFGPQAQPDMWTATQFKKIYTWMRPGGVLVTYCAKGEVRRTMEAVGFRTERLPGPPHKREMLRATKDA
jgi:tRNA U34 5-methylaminomethyl-2-thiouridine-forming methyltransferase MnmC